MVDFCIYCEKRLESQFHWICPKCAHKMSEGFNPCLKKPVVVWAKQMDESFTVETLEGTHQGKAGDYLIIGVRGERYPCDKGIFEETYEVVHK